MLPVSYVSDSNLVAGVTIKAVKDFSKNVVVVEVTQKPVESTQS